MNTWGGVHKKVQQEVGERKQLFVYVMYVCSPE